MVKVELVDNIQILTIKGELNADEVLKEAEKLSTYRTSIIGQITDIREMTAQPIADQKKLEMARKAQPHQVPNAILGKDNAMSSLVRIFINFTKAGDTKYFTDLEEAKAWIKSFHQ
jgi:hypothetical protein